MTAVPNAMDGFDSGDDGDDTPAVDPSGAIAALNGLLRGEISAAQTYRDVIEKMAAHAAAPVDVLGGMRAEHDRAAGLLRGRVVALGGEPSPDAGLWGKWEHVLQSALSLLGGDTGGVRAVHEAEEHGLSDYQSALNAVDDVSARLIQDQLMPAQERHLATLAGLLR